MSETNKADECKRLLDNGWLIQLHRNARGHYEATALSKTATGKLQEALNSANLETDDAGKLAFEREVVSTEGTEPSSALYWVTEKVFGNL